MFQVFHFQNNLKFKLRYYETYVYDENYSFNEMDDIPLTQEYNLNNSKIMILDFEENETSTKEIESLFLLGNAYQKCIQIADYTLNSTIEETKRNNYHISSMLLIPPVSFNHRLSKIIVLLPFTTTEIIPGDNWIGIYLSIGSKYILVSENDKSSKTIFFPKLVINRYLTFHERRWPTIHPDDIFDLDSFKSQDELRKVQEKEIETQKSTISGFNDPGDY